MRVVVACCLLCSFVDGTDRRRRDQASHREPREDWEDGGAVVYSITGHTGNWLDRVEFDFHNGTHIEYVNGHGDGGSGGSVSGPWTLQRDEIIISVQQEVRRSSSYHEAHGLGDMLSFTTSINNESGRSRIRGRAVKFEGNQVADGNEVIDFHAGEGMQISGLRLDANRVVEVYQVPFVEGCNGHRQFPSAQRERHDFDACLQRIPVLEECEVHCAEGYHGGSRTFRCMVPGAELLGVLPECEMADVPENWASALLATVAAITAAVSGAYGGDRSGGQVNGGTKLSMSGIWRDQEYGRVFQVSPSGRKSAMEQGRIARWLVRGLTDLPLSSFEHRLWVQEVEPKPTRWVQAASPSHVFEEFVCRAAADALSLEWRGQLLWQAGEGIVLERVTQHSMTLTVPGSKPWRLRRQKLTLMRLWTFAFPAIIAVLALSANRIHGGGIASLVYLITGVTHVALLLKPHGQECRVPAALPRIGTVGVLFALAWAEVRTGQTLQKRIPLGAVALCALFVMSDFGSDVLKDGRDIFLAGTVVAVCSCYLAILIPELLFTALAHNNATTMAAFGALVVGVLQLAAAKTWSNQLDTKFSAQDAIELRDNRTEAAEPSSVNLGVNGRSLSTASGGALMSASSSSGSSTANPYAV